MSEREDVLNDHRRRALTGDAKHALLQSTLAAVKKAGRRTGGVQTMDKQRERANNAAVSFFWNYNTVESVLLFCAVLVNLAVSVSCHGCLMSVVQLVASVALFRCLWATPAVVLCRVLCSRVDGSTLACTTRKRTS